MGLMRRLLLSYGLGRTILLMTGASIVVSEIVNFMVSYAADGQVGWSSVMIAFIVPAIVAPLLGGFQLRLLYELEEAREKLQHLAITDELTQTFNRRHFMEAAERVFLQAQRGNGPFSVVLLDADDFKQVNDAHGHLVGDGVLRQLAENIRKSIRKHDLLARYGGEEFIVLLPDTHLEGALEVAQRIQEAILHNPAEVGGKPLKVTVSMGVATFEPTMQSLDEILSLADKAQYQAKNAGKNRIELAPTICKD
ncbi:MAG: GGDEF domain-containing protein [Meiothermus sp.]|nr:GGDEF domain-containing protein [Meiothermus sp.]